MNREESPVGTSPSWTPNVIHTCMGIEPGEKVLVFVDDEIVELDVP